MIMKASDNSNDYCNCMDIVVKTYLDFQKIFNL